MVPADVSGTDFLGDLHVALTALEFSHKELVRFHDQHRLMLHKLLATRPEGDRVAELWAAMATGLSFAGRYEEALPYAEAGLQLEQDVRWEEMARSAQVNALFNLGREQEAKAAWIAHRARFPQQEWGEPLVQVIRAKRQKRSGLWMLGIGVALVASALTFRLLATPRNVWWPVLGVVLTMAGWMLSSRSERRMRAIGKDLRS